MVAEHFSTSMRHVSLSQLHNEGGLILLSLVGSSATKRTWEVGFCVFFIGSLSIENFDSDRMYIPDDALVPVLSMTAASFLLIASLLFFTRSFDPRAFSTSDNPHL